MHLDQGDLSGERQRAWKEGIRLFSWLAALCLAAAAGAGMGMGRAGGAEVPWSTPERVASGFAFTEGPVWHEDGHLLFCDVTGNRIVKWTAPDTTETFRQPSGNAPGLAFDQQGRLIACEGGAKRVSRTELDGNMVTLASEYQGNPFNFPNDVVVKSDGSIYFTDISDVFRIPSKGALTLVTRDVGAPNGLAFSPHEEKLYVGDMSSGRVHVFDVLPDGRLQGGEVFVQVPSADGMKVDRKGNLYVTSGSGVMVFNAEGERIGIIEFPEQPSNCCFGDIGGNTLFVTARSSLYRVRLCDSELTADSKRNINLTWWSLRGRTYAIYRSSDMVTWELAADDVGAGTGAATRWMDGTRPLLSPEVPRRYYRVSEKR